MTNQGDISGN